MQTFKQKQFRRMNSVIDNMEAVLIEAHKAKGWQWVHEEPLWVTWSLEKFGKYSVPAHSAVVCLQDHQTVTSVAEVIVPYHRSLNAHIDLVDTLRSHSVTFEASREVMSKWVEQPWFEGSSWDAKWEDLCEVEVERWDIAR